MQFIPTRLHGIIDDPTARALTPLCVAPEAAAGVEAGAAPDAPACRRRRSAATEGKDGPVQVARRRPGPGRAATARSRSRGDGPSQVARQGHQVMVDGNAGITSGFITSVQAAFTGIHPTRAGAPAPQDDPVAVAHAGNDAMMRGERGVVPGASNKLLTILPGVVPDSVLAEIHQGGAPLKDERGGRPPPQGGPKRC